MSKAVVVCGPAYLFEEWPEERREALEAAEGPYHRIACPVCAQLMMLSRPGRELLEGGLAHETICAECLVEFMKYMESRKDERK